MKLEDTYAQALFKSTDGKDAGAAQKRVAHFRELLKRRGHESLLPKVGKAFARIAKKAESAKTVSIKVAKEGQTVIDGVEKIFTERIGKEARYEASLDESIIGGFVAEGAGVRVDHSHKSALLSLYRKLTTQ